MIKKFRTAGTPELFLPMLFSRQPCESTFRQLRSMTSIFWTRINFNLLELLHMIGRLELSNEIVYDKLSADVNFPRAQSRTGKCIHYDLPSNDEFIKVLEEAKMLALFDAEQLGMHVSESKINISGIVKHGSLNKTFRPSSSESDDEVVDSTEEADEENIPMAFLRHNSDKETQKKYVEIDNKDGSSRTVLKSSVIFALIEMSGTLSKDRLTRVQSPSTPKSNKASRKRRMNNDMESTRESDKSKRAKKN